MDRQVMKEIQFSIDSIKRNRAGFQISVKIISPYEIKIHDVFLKSRGCEQEIILKYKVRYLCNKSKIYISLNLNEIKSGPIYWDFYIKVICDGEIYCFQINNPSFLVLAKLNSRLFSIIRDGKIYYPYIGTKGSLSICVRPIHQYDHFKYIIKEWIAIILHFIVGTYLKKRNIWIIYEKFCETAQDNAFYFFKYCYEKQKRANVFFVIKNKSKDFKYVEPYKSKIIPFMSIKHILYLLNCELVISSEAKTHGYIWRENRGFIRRIFNKKNHVFLQHGVIGFKKIDSAFHKRSANETKLFIVSSELEKQLVEMHLKYSPKEIAITGLARWDYVPTNKADKSRQILLLPTWRNWLDQVDKNSFVTSVYFKNYVQLLTSKKLKQFLTKNQIKLKCCLHPRICEHADEFRFIDFDKIEIVTQKEERIIDLIHNSKLLITDYSSVAWDMFYLKKPVVFFQFDKEDYLRYQGSYLDLNELFGDRCTRIEELIEILEYYVDRDFAERECYSNLRSKYFTYFDSNNCERIYNSIMQINK